MVGLQLLLGLASGRLGLIVAGKARVRHCGADELTIRHVVAWEVVVVVMGLRLMLVVAYGC